MVPVDSRRESNIDGMWNAFYFSSTRIEGKRPDNAIQVDLQSRCIRRATAAAPVSSMKLDVPGILLFMRGV